MAKARKIVVEVIIPASVETVWERTQNPDHHVAWDIRFTQINYLPKTKDGDFQLMDYRTKLAFGITINGFGRYLGNQQHSHSSFEFDSNDWKSLIKNGRGIWLYRPCAEGAFFKTVFDYDLRYGIVGRILDRLLFRSIFQLATEWGFETLRMWCGGNQSVVKSRRSYFKFLWFYVSRRLGQKPQQDAARSWLGSGHFSESLYEKQLTSGRGFDFPVAK